MRTASGRVQASAAESVLSRASWLVRGRKYVSGDWVDEIGAVNAAPGAGANAPLFDGGLTAFTYDKASPDYHSMGNASVLDPGSGAFSVMVWCKVADVTGVHLLMSKHAAAVATDQGWSLQARGDVANDPVRFFSRRTDTTNVAADAGTYTADTWFTAGGVSTGSAGTWTAYKNGVAGTPGTALTGSLTNSVNAYLATAGPLSTTTSLTGTIRAAAFFKGTALTAAEMLQLHGELTEPARICCDGDSLTSGYGLTANNSYPAQLRALISSVDYVWENFGVAGQTLVQMEADAATQIDTLPKGVLIAWGGINDLNDGGATSAATVEGRIQTYCQNRRAAGWRVIVSTLTPTVSITGAEETNRLAVNTWLRANYTSFADALIDPANEANLQNVANATYFQADQIHLTAAGYAIVAGLADTALGTLGIS